MNRIEEVLNHYIFTTVDQLIDDKKLENKKIVLFGLSSITFTIKGYLDTKSKEIIGYIDNDQYKVKEFNENIVDVCSKYFNQGCCNNIQKDIIKGWLPELLLQKFDDEIVVLVASKHYDAILQQLLGWGYIENEHIFKLIEPTKMNELMKKIRIEREGLDNIEYSNDLSVVLIAKNEAEYIYEWIEYHRMIGVTHFYIYDNDSTDDLKGKLKWYIEKGIVTYISFPGKKMQLPAYNHAIENYKNDTKYMAFIDADEFLVPVENKKLLDIIDDIFNAHKFVGGIGINWRVYGTSFHEERKPGLVVENYKYRGRNIYGGHNPGIKTLCNPRVVKGFTKNPHEVKYIDDYHCVSEHGSIIKGAGFFDGLCSKLRLNHYVTKSKAEFYERMRKGKADQDVVYTQKWIDTRYNHLKEYNDLYDPIMDCYIAELRLRVAEIERITADLK